MNTFKLVLYGATQDLGSIPPDPHPIDFEIVTESNVVIKEIKELSELKMELTKQLYEMIEVKFSIGKTKGDK